MAVGSKVEAKVKDWRQFYSGKITKCNADGSFDITFDDGEQVRGVLASQIKGGAASASSTPAQTPSPGLAVGSNDDAKCTVPGYKKKADARTTSYFDIDLKRSDIFEW